jgi:hypothetical protein
MHTLVIANPIGYKGIVEKIVTQTSDKYDKACYISIKDSHQIIIKMIDDMRHVDSTKFIVIDASKDVGEVKAIDEKTFLISIPTLFNVYLFLKDLIQTENVNALILDSVSHLINRHPTLPLKDMLTNLLLEVGSLRCDSVIFANAEHKDHEVVRNLDPFIAKTIVL